MKEVSPTIIIDTREQDPFEFENLSSERGTLATGDYSILGLESWISVERKSLTDLVKCVGSDRERFVRELQRLRAYPFRMLVVEASEYVIFNGGWSGKVTPSQVLGSLASWTARYCLPVWLGGDHEASGKFVEKFLYQCARHVASDYSAAASFIEQAKPKRAAG